MPSLDRCELEPLAAHRWSSIEATLAGLREIDAWGRRHEDLRGVFAAAYAIVTAAVAEAVRRGEFSDRAWIDAVALKFADRYRLAMLAAARGTAARGWGPALRCSRGRGLVPIVALLHGMIAHIHYDLPCSLAACAPIDARRVADYARLGNVICDATREIQHGVIDGYAPALRSAHQRLGGFDTWVTNTVVRAWRSRALVVAIPMSASPWWAIAWRRRLELETAALALVLDAVAWLIRRTGAGVSQSSPTGCIAPYPCARTVGRAAPRRHLGLPARQTRQWPGHSSD